MKIDSCIIVRNESKNLDSLISKLLQFSNEIYIVDTGSEDNSLYKLYEYENNITNIHIKHYKWCNDFSKARNFSFSLSTNSDYIFFCDGNDDISDSLLLDICIFSRNEYNCNLPNIIIGSKDYNGVIKDVPILVKRIKKYKWKGKIKAVLEYDKSEAYKLPLNKSILIHKETNNLINNLNTYYVYEQMNEIFDTEGLLDYGINLMYSGNNIQAYLIFKDMFLNKEIEIGYRIDALIYAARSYYECYYQAPFSHNIEDLFEHYLKFNILNKWAYQYIADYYYDNEKYEDAMHLYKKIYEMKDSEEVKAKYNIKPQNMIFILFRLVLTSFKIGDIESSKLYNNIILSIEPDNKDALWNKENIFTNK